MTHLVLKALLSGLIVAAASEAAKRSPLFAALIVSLPLTSVLALTWLHADTRSTEQVAALSWQILLVVIPSLVFFVALPLALRAGSEFGAAMLAACLTTAAAYTLWLRFVLAR